ncbi:MAG: hypothetical protein HY931_03210 [Candidatus Falkowbacteria bacterium]|nr:MAG: hypothetical protein HY931_03210 [Candidatus Falkowbacteria bacterium]
MEKHKNIFSVVATIVALSIAYYFLYSLPSYNREKLNLEKERQAEDIRIAQDKAELDKQKKQQEESIRMSELAGEIQNDCIKNVQNSVVFYFDRANTTFSPLFYPYENEAAFNKNERLLTGLGAYQSCITNDPRYTSENTAIKSILIDADIAEVDINNYMVEYRDKTPELCSSYLLTSSAKQKCESLETKQYNFLY